MHLYDLAHAQDDVAAQIILLKVYYVLWIEGRCKHTYDHIFLKTILEGFLS